MKHLLVSSLAAACALLGAANVHAQAAGEPSRLADKLTQRGRVLVGGGIAGYYSDRASSDDRWFIQIAPAAAYFLRDRFALGGSIGVALYDQDSGYASSTLIGPNAYYDLVLGEQFSILFTAGAHFGRYSVKFEDERLSTGLFQLSVAAPLMVHVSDAVALGIGPRWEGNGTFRSDPELDATGYWLFGLASVIAATF